MTLGEVGPISSQSECLGRRGKSSQCGLVVINLFVCSEVGRSGGRGRGARRDVRTFLFRHGEVGEPLPS